ncbi:nudix hydrolase 19, chloroplastic [Impatiens glandulifera]|uniref:nudix hydrolase 19, chloroplastic n=1 Tax=Impatiens glandulifera TaxID=253017 RepID=UPI001FB092E3|nr:nudix hydrolase 19, chloroplastic [Impatiens glandulifera]
MNRAMRFLFSSPTTTSIHSLSTKHLSRFYRRSNSDLVAAMSIRMNFHTFAGNPIKAKTPKSDDPYSSTSAVQSLKTILLGRTHEPPNFKVLPFRKGRPLAASVSNSPPNWHLGWLSFDDFKVILENTGFNLGEEMFVYLGTKEDVVYWAVDVSEANRLTNELGNRKFCFVELRTLMVATDWSDALAMGYLSIAGHARALMEWHNTSRFCGYCGEKTISMEAGRRKECSNELCKKRIYPRVDPVVIMLVIDKKNDRALLSRQSRFVPRMWSCLAGFIEPGESLEEAVRRETWEETGIEVGDVVYHSSQPWPVGPSSMPCQLMVGFIAYAKSLEINVDKEELEDAQWHSREDVKKALTFAEYNKAQQTASEKVEQMCKGNEQGRSLTADFNVESGDPVPMFVPGPYAIAHHLISSWAFQDGGSDNNQSDQFRASLSNL